MPGEHWLVTGRERLRQEQLPAAAARPAAAGARRRGVVARARQSAQRVAAAQASRVGVAGAASGVPLSVDGARVHRVGLHVEHRRSRARRRPTRRARVEELLEELELTALAERPAVDAVVRPSASRADRPRARESPARAVARRAVGRARRGDGRAASTRRCDQVAADGTQLVCASHSRRIARTSRTSSMLDAGRVVRSGPTRARSVPMEPANLAEVPPMRGREQHAGATLTSTSTDGSHARGPRAPPPRAPRSRPRRTPRCRRADARASRARSPSTLVGTTNHSISEWKWPSPPNANAATGNSAMTNGIAKQCTMQIVESAIATRSKYFESNIRARGGRVRIRPGRRAYRNFAACSPLFWWRRRAGATIRNRCVRAPTLSR